MASEYIGLSDAGTKEFEIMRNTARVLLDRDVYQLGKLGCSGHAPAPEMAARLGMVQDMPKILHRFASAYQISRMVDALFGRFPKSAMEHD